MVFIRDRTNLFISFRQSYTHHPYDDGGALDGTNEPLMEGEAIEMESMPPTWLDLTTKFDQLITQIQADIAELQPLHKQNSLPGFDDRTSVDKEIERLNVCITRDMQRGQENIKVIKGVAETLNDPVQARLARNIQVSMATKLQECSTTFRKMQSSYLQALNQDQLGELPGMITAAHTMEDDVAMSQQVLERGPSQQSYEDIEVAQREREIQKIAEGILEIAEIFNQLQTMVIDQGTIIDRIDYNVEHTLVNVKGADEQLVKGERYQKRTQKCKIILLLSLIVLGLMLVLIFKPRHKVIYDHAPAPEHPAPADPAPADPAPDHAPDHAQDHAE